jgi:glycine/D-amino acid oxidase-like deaminating enzyme
VPGEPWWTLEAPFDDAAPPLERDLDLDVAIVGGGYTGLWTALALREREPALRLAVLERDRCGEGPSGRNGGFLHGYWASLPRLRDHFGDDAAVRLARASEGAVAAVRALGDDVWLREAPLLVLSAAPGQDAAVERLVGAAAAVGAPEEAVAVGPGELPASPAFRRGARVRDGATVQPARLVRALRRAVLAAGIELYERTPALSVDDGVVRTPGGTVRAPELVLATGAWSAGRPPLARWLTPFGSSIVLTEPVPELLAEIGWTGGEPIVDGRAFVHYFRTTPDGRVLMGSGSGPIGYRGRVDDRFALDGPAAGRAAAGLRRLLPALAEARIEHAWGGPIDVSTDQIPFFLTLPGTRIHAGAGYTGNGVGPSWLGGQVLASLAGGREDEWTALPLVRRQLRSLPPEPLRRLGGGLYRAAMIAAEEADERGRRPGLAARAGVALPRLLGLDVGRR